jgi:hypothetical protein
VDRRTVQENVDDSSIFLGTIQKRVKNWRLFDCWKSQWLGGKETADEWALENLYKEDLQAK